MSRLIFWIRIHHFRIRIYDSSSLRFMWVDWYNHISWTDWFRYDNRWSLLRFMSRSITFEFDLIEIHELIDILRMVLPFLFLVQLHWNDWSFSIWNCIRSNFCHSSKNELAREAWWPSKLFSIVRSLVGCPLISPSVGRLDSRIGWMFPGIV